MTSPTLAAEQPKVLGLPATVLLAVACGLGVGNSYYAQPLIGPISQSLGLAPQLSGLIVAATQMGYAAGLILIVPLGDLIENRRLISLLLTTAGLALLGQALAPSSASFLAAGLIVGTASAGTQVIIALAGGLVPGGSQGRIIGFLTSGVFLGILLARPSASLLTYYFGWRAAFLVPSILMTGVAALLWRCQTTSGIDPLATRRIDPPGWLLAIEAAVAERVVHGVHRGDPRRERTPSIARRATARGVPVGPRGRAAVQM